MNLPESISPNTNNPVLLALKEYADAFEEFERAKERFREKKKVARKKFLQQCGLWDRVWYRIRGIPRYYFNLC